MNNLRMNFCTFLISSAIKTLPQDWQTKKAVKNLISAGAISITENDNPLCDSCLNGHDGSSGVYQPCGCDKSKQLNSTPPSAE